MRLLIFPILILLFSLGCDSPDDRNYPISQTFKYLALGDSYTIGQSVCEKCRFPEQLKDSLESRIPDSNVNIEMVATTGWTTSNLIQAIDGRNLPNDFDLVTLLIGVNNQYQHYPQEIYETEFIELVNTSIEKVGGDKSKVIVVSIPDYAFTPFGQNTGGSESISAELASYNAFAAQYCQANNITYVNITDITQQGLTDPTLVASDGLHPSTVAYTKFVERLLPKALTILDE